MSADSIATSRRELRRELQLLVGRVPADVSRNVRHQRLRAQLLGLRQEAAAASSACTASASPSVTARWHASSFSTSSRVHPLEEAEVEERDAAVGQQQEVAGVGVAGELVVAVEAADEEAEDDLAEAVALGLRAAA